MYLKIETSVAQHFTAEFMSSVILKCSSYHAKAMNNFVLIPVYMPNSSFVLYVPRDSFSQTVFLFLLD